MKLGISHQRPADFSDERFNYLRTMGVDTMEVRLDSQEATFQHLRDIRDQVVGAGFELHEIMLDDLYSAPAFTLGLPQRDAVIDRLCVFIRDLGRLGIRYTTYAWHTGGAYQTGTTESRGAQTRLFRDADAQALPNAFDDTYDDATMWANYRHFIDRVLPVAQSAGVHLQLHPNDPPVNHQGVARIFRSTDAFRQAIEIAGGDNHAGILFCVGTWSEMPGADGAGEDIVAAIREFGASGHIHQVHFRNTSAPLPNFHETFPDNGYVDLVAVMRALQEVGFDGIVVPDHVPGDGRIEEAYTFGYIRALIQALG
ncbi:MAG: mannonate dehydratase [Gammaproteobacteria bacterium]|nr:mannonate dehydratase [Gammaproteobacteria bacterium]